MHTFKHHFYILLILLIAQSTVIYGQNKIDTAIYVPIKASVPPPLTTNHMEVGLNATYLIGQFVPLTTRPILSGVFDYSFKQYTSDSKAFRFGFGSSLGLGFFFDDILTGHFGIRLGYERRKHLYGKWYYTRGLDGIFYLGDILGRPTDLNSLIGLVPFGIGLGPVIGIEYHFNPYMYLSTESTLLIGLPNLVQVIPPTAIFFNYVFTPNAKSKHLDAPSR